ncbi:hypothetical protein U1Q18_030410 [Sarracenia purpurea var. burkii]
MRCLPPSSTIADHRAVHLRRPSRRPSNQSSTAVVHHAVQLSIPPLLPEEAPFIGPFTGIPKNLVRDFGFFILNQRAKMRRTRLLWFTFGFTSAASVITHFVFKDIWADRQFLSSQLMQRFDDLDARVSNLESIIRSNPASHQDKEKVN